MSTQAKQIIEAGLTAKDIVATALHALGLESRRQPTSAVTA